MGKVLFIFPLTYLCASQAFTSADENNVKRLEADSENPKNTYYSYESGRILMNAANQRMGNRIYSDTRSAVVEKQLSGGLENRQRPECRNYDNCGNSIKSVSLQSREEMISLHNTQSDAAAAALIIKSIQPGAAGSICALIRHTASRTCTGREGGPGGR